MIEVGGHTDSTGSETRNFALSRQRADAVIQYLAVAHKIPVRRFVTPMGYGKTEAVADNGTASGRAQNRRVEVKLILNRGMSQSGSTPSSVKQLPRIEDQGVGCRFDYLKAPTKKGTKKLRDGIS